MREIQLLTYIKYFLILGKINENSREVWKLACEVLKQTQM